MILHDKRYLKAWWTGRILTRKGLIQSFSSSGLLFSNQMIHCFSKSVTLWYCFWMRRLILHISGDEHQNLEIALRRRLAFGTGGEMFWTLPIKFTVKRKKLSINDLIILKIPCRKPIGFGILINEWFPVIC